MDQPQTPTLSGLHHAQPPIKIGRIIHLNRKSHRPAFQFFLSFFSVCMWYLKGIWPASGQQNLGNSATKALSSYFGNWLASQSPNLTWPLGLAFLTNLKTISRWHLHICFSACSSPCTMHMNTGCKPTPQNKKVTDPNFNVLSFYVCMWYLKGIWPAKWPATCSQFCHQGSAKLLWQLTGQSIP